MATPVTNFGKVTVSTTYGAGDLSIVLTAGHGSRLPSTFPYPLTWWDATTYSDPADDPNREIITVTARTGDTLTITRASEGTSASTKSTAAKTYKMVLSITAAMYNGIFDLSLSQDFRGLSLQTHPNSDVAAKKVQLMHADAIVMDDGLEVSTWDDVVADVTASGVGGIDTGTEVASVWYEIYAIYNGTTKSLLLHRAKDYFLDESQTTDDNAYPLRRVTNAAAPNGTNLRVAQGFKVDVAGPIEFVDVKLEKLGAPTGNFWFTIQANSGGVPSDTALATSDLYDVSRMTTTATWARMPFRTPYSASAATTYHLVLHGDFTASDTANLKWRADVTASAYANGSASWSTNATTGGWTSVAADDFCFKVYVTENDTSVTLPTGYTQKALIGYVYNDSASDFKHFRQKDRTVFCGHEADWSVGTGTAATPTLLDLAAFLPPVTTELTAWLYNSGSASGNGLGGLDATDVSSTSSTYAVGSMNATVAGVGYMLTCGPLVLSPYQGIMSVTGAGTLTIGVNSFTW